MIFKSWKSSVLWLGLLAVYRSVSQAKSHMKQFSTGLEQPTSCSKIICEECECQISQFGALHLRGLQPPWSMLNWPHGKHKGRRVILSKNWCVRQESTWLSQNMMQGVGLVQITCFPPIPSYVSNYSMSFGYAEVNFWAAKEMLFSFYLNWV